MNKISTKNFKKFMLSLIILTMACSLLNFTTIKGGESDNILTGALQTSNCDLWTDNGTAICKAANDQQEPQIASDGLGGAIIAWYDNRNSGTTGIDVYAQKIDSAGNIKWAPNGVAICTMNDSQIRVNLISDGAGGAIITWCNYSMTNGDIYAQKIDSEGITQWTTNGIVICNNTGHQDGPQIISDGAEGAIITWIDERNGNKDIYAQKINSEGITQWTTNGIVICNDTSQQQLSFHASHQIVSDGLGGAIITWDDNRNSGTTNIDIYAQKTDSLGLVQWDTNGIIICNATGIQEKPELVSDGAGGIVIIWEDNRGSNDDIYAQKIDLLGLAQWDTNGVVICDATGNQLSPKLVNDGTGGVIISWNDGRGGNQDIYAQKVDSLGLAQWDNNGVVICNTTGFQVSPKLVSDGAGGAIIGWEDNYNIKAQIINSAGVVQCDSNGTVICNALNDQFSLELVSDGAGGAILTWQDYRNIGTTGVDIFAQKISISSSGGKPNIPGFNLAIVGVIFVISVISVAKMLNRKKILMHS